MNVLKIREQFPILNQSSAERPVVYFDSATTALKHQVVSQELDLFLNSATAAVWPNSFKWSQTVTNKYQQARKNIAEFMGCQEKEVVFTFGTTLGLITVAEMLKQKLQPGDEIICNTQEHVSNQLQWWKVAKETGAVVKVIEMKPNQKLSEVISDHITDKTKVITFASVTNTTGQKRDLIKIGKICRKNNIISVIDGAQQVASRKIELSKWGIDFYVWGTHKLFSLPGLGIIFGREKLLNELDPPFAGGASTHNYNLDGNVKYKPSPFKFEYGTQNIPAIIATGKVCSWLNEVGMKNVEKHLLSLQQYAINQMSLLKGVEIYNRTIKSANIVFNMKNISASDLSDYLGKNQIAVRAGDLCSKLNNFCPTNNSIRVSFSIYNTKQEIDYFVSVLKEATVEKIVDAIIGVK